MLSSLKGILQIAFKHTEFSQKFQNLGLNILVEPGENW